MSFFCNYCEDYHGEYQRHYCGDCQLYFENDDIEYHSSHYFCVDSDDEETNSDDEEINSDSDNSDSDSDNSDSDSDNSDSDNYLDMMDMIAKEQKETVEKCKLNNIKRQEIIKKRFPHSNVADLIARHAIILESCTHVNYITGYWKVSNQSNYIYKRKKNMGCCGSTELCYVCEVCNTFVSIYIPIYFENCENFDKFIDSLNIECNPGFCRKQIFNHKQRYHPDTECILCGCHTMDHHCVDGNKIYINPESYRPLYGDNIENKNAERFKIELNEQVNAFLEKHYGEWARKFRDSLMNPGPKGKFYPHFLFDAILCGCGFSIILKCKICLIQIKYKNQLKELNNKEIYDHIFRNHLNIYGRIYNYSAFDFLSYNGNYRPNDRSISGDKILKKRVIEEGMYGISKKELTKYMNEYYSHTDIEKALIMSSQHHECIFCNSRFESLEEEIIRRHVAKCPSMLKLLHPEYAK